MVAGGKGRKVHAGVYIVSLLAVLRYIARPG